MLRSHWDIEVYAKDFQEDRWREAVRRRLVEEAAGGLANADAANPFNLAFARLVSTWKSRIASGRGGEVPQPVAEREETTGSRVVPQRTSTARGRLAQPYADMVIVARGPKAGVVEQPSGVRDC